MDMTPMIDVVFLLIIFFMIITDLTQQDLEDLELPIALSATEDKPDPDEKRPIFNIKHTGEIIVRKEPLYSPETHDGLKDPMVDVKRKLAIIRGLWKEQFDSVMGFIEQVCRSLTRALLEAGG